MRDGHLKEVFNKLYKCFGALKPCANGCNNSQHCWANNVGSCCVPLHAAKSLTGFKLCARTPNNMQQGVQTDATCNVQQCGVRLHRAELGKFLCFEEVVARGRWLVLAGSHTWRFNCI